jgi:amidohydrolase
MSIILQIKELAQKFTDDIISVRRHLHTFPELSFEEFETSRYIQQQLTKIGVPFTAGIVKTGIVASIKGKNPDKKIIALRADIDALPIREQNNQVYCSKNEGVMHACGHDVHTASLLGTMMILNEIKDHFEGTIQCIFQPGEEKLPGGAKLMIEQGVLNNPTPKAILGQHVFPELEVGKVGFRKGLYMASTDELYFTIKGKGGHAALPQQTNSPIVMASHLILALKEFADKQTQIPTILAIGKVEALGATNIIPEKVEMAGTFRTMNETWRAEAHQKMTEIATQTVEKFGGSCDVNIVKGYPFLVNDDEVTQKCIETAIMYLGADNVVTLDKRMTAEDFAYFSQELPACFYRLGVRNESKGITSNLHTNTFDVDEHALTIGAGMMSLLALNLLESYK